MTQAIMTDAIVASDGTIQINLQTSISAGYANSCAQYAPWGVYSIPLNNCVVNVEQQSLSNVVVTGYNNTITDNNFQDKAQGTITIYSPMWYNINSSNGCYFQKVNTTNKEAQMMGNSTNKVLIDIIQLLLNILILNPSLTKPDITTINNDLTNLQNGSNLVTNNYKPSTQW